jgi:hypothetical protein
MADQATRNNHYVPEWYQRGFLALGESQFFYLDMSPEKILPDGRSISTKSVQKWGPKKCFAVQDLYSTFFGTTVNDEVERFLFGSIDRRGAIAVRAFIGGEMSAMHYAFEDFFEYMDAQRLRTPKGLAWIKSRYSSLDQLNLMREMQELRFIHCTMWTESVREIVSAETSDVKFIVSDHPVTFYNAAVPPTSPQCAYPNDAPFEWIGTQTIFVLDANTCLILSHLEYAKNPKTANSTQQRTNARYRGDSLVRTDTYIRTRRLSQDEVISINFLLKSRASKYLAASNNEWLHPERSYRGSWEDLAQVLLPRDELWQFGGETYIGFTDGSSKYQDAFGRTSKAHEYLRREKPKSGLLPNDFCGCGSAQKYKYCCKDLPTSDRPSWDVYSIRERNLMLCHAVQRILGLQSGKSWDDVRRELSADQVKQIYEVFASLWPPDTDLSELLPRPRRDTFRALYLGMGDPRTVQETVVGWLPYFDQVILTHPFINPVRIKPDFNPIESASKHKAQTLKNVLMLLLLEPYIDAGLVHLIPDPVDFNPQFGMSALKMAEERTANWKPDEKSKKRFEVLARDDFQRHLLQLPERSLAHFIKRGMPGATEAEIEKVIAYSNSRRESDPYALLQAFEPGEAGAQFLYVKGYTLESAMFLASLTGSAIYTNLEAHWHQLNSCARQAGEQPDQMWAPMVNELQKINFPIDLKADTLHAYLNNGQFGNMKVVLRRLMNMVQQPGPSSQGQELAQQLAKAAKTIEKELVKTSKTRLIGRIELSVPEGGFERNEVRRLLLSFGRVKQTQPIPLVMFVKLDDNLSDLNE